MTIRLCFVGALLVGKLATAGVVVTNLPERGLMARAGVQAGDVIEAWQPPGKQAMVLNTPLDLDLVQFKHAQLNSIELTGHRDERPMRWAIPPGEWDYAAHPANLKSQVAALATIVTQLADRGVTDKEVHQAIQSALANVAEPASLAWLLTQTAESLSPQERWELIDWLRRDLEALNEVGLPTQTLGLSLLRIADALESHPDFGELQSVYQSAIDALSVTDDRPYLLARALERIGGLEARRGQTALAQQRLERTLKLVQPIQPASFVAAGALNGLGNVAVSQGDLKAAEDYFSKVEAMLRQVGADESALRVPIANLGSIAAMTGDLAAAQTRFDNALGITERTLGDASTSPLLNNLGILSVRRGDLARAEYYYQRALMINERTQQRYRFALNLYNLADVADARGDLQSAITLIEQAVEQFNVLSPDSVALANALSVSAGFQLRSGNAAPAKAQFQRALQMYQSAESDTSEQAVAVTGLGEVALIDGDTVAAETHMKRALHLRRSAAPRGIFTGTAYYNLAEVYLQAGNLERAEKTLRESLSILSEVAPDSTEEAKSLHALARVYLARGQHQTSLALYADAVTAIEQQTKRLGGADDSRSRFNDRYSDMFREYLRLSIDTGQTERAFNILERYRARSLLALLAERDLVLDADLPEELRQERQRLTTEYDQLQQKLINAAPDQQSALATERRALQARRAALTERLRVESPRYAQLKHPVPLDYMGARQALAPGTVALSYSVHPQVTFAFVLSKQHEELKVHQIDIDEPTLREKIKRFRLLIDSGRQHPKPPDEALIAAAGELYDLLVQPLLDSDANDRLLLVPDGPLHLLPFAALIERGTNGLDATLGGRYLVELAPLHQTLSLTLYDSLRRIQTAHSSTKNTLLAFAADHRTVTRDAITATTRQTARFEQLRDLPALPWAKTEADQIARLFNSQGLALSEGAATEERVKALSPSGPRFLHFAAHSFITNETPLDSGLVLDSDTAVDNGLLQAWEIFEQLRLETDLVVLSACESALGPELGGDGLIGLTRAFLHAGAGSVVASLWRVSDRSTSDLMTTLYQQLKDGRTYDQALRQAQLQMIAGSAKRNWWRRLWNREEIPSDFRHPFHWAAFTLSGDYR